MITQTTIIWGFLAILTLIDIFTYNKKKGYIPSILTSTFLFLSFISGTTFVMLIVSCLIALMLTDLNAWKGIADFKTFVAVGMSYPNIEQLFMFSGILVVLPVIYGLIIILSHGIPNFSNLKELASKTKRDAPYIPFITAAYLITMVII